MTNLVSHVIVPSPTTPLGSWELNHNRERMCMIGVAGNDRLFILGNNKIYQSTTNDPLYYETLVDSMDADVLLYNKNNEKLYAIKDNSGGHFVGTFIFYRINSITGEIEETKNVFAAMGITTNWNWTMCENGDIAGVFSNGTNLYFTKFASTSIPSTTTNIIIKANLGGSSLTPPSIFSIGNYIHILNLEYDGSVKKPKYYQKTIDPDVWTVNGVNPNNSIIGTNALSVEDSGRFYVRILGDSNGVAYAFFYVGDIYGSHRLYYSRFNTVWMAPVSLYGTSVNYPSGTGDKGAEPACFSINIDENKLFVVTRYADHPTNPIDVPYIKVNYINIPSGVQLLDDALYNKSVDNDFTKVEYFSAPFKYINKDVTDVGFINTNPDGTAIRIARDGSIVPNLPPGPVTGLNATSDADLVTLSWIKEPIESNLAGYEITRSVVRDDTGRATGDVIDLDDKTAVSYEDTDVVNGSSTSATGTIYIVEYSYSVKAVNISGLKSAAAVVNALPKDKIPDRVSNVSIISGDAELTLHFTTPVSDVAGVLIVRGEGDTSLNPVEGTEYSVGDYLDISDVNSLVVYNELLGEDEDVEFVDDTYSIENSHTYIYKIYVYDAEPSPVGPAYSLYYRITGTPLGAPVIVSVIPRNAYQMDILFDQAMKADSDLFSYSNYKLVISGDPLAVTQLNVNVGIVLSSDKKTVTLATKEQDSANTYVLTVNPTS